MGEAVALPAEQIGQELQFPYRLRGQFPGPGIAGDLTDIGSAYDNIVKSDSGQTLPDNVVRWFVPAFRQRGQKVPPTGGVGVRGFPLQVAF